jgi:NAD(P)-dependent dehydrogenase (short-subunit alcohol dehydrogenase family)
MKLDSAVALVTGGASGLGEATVRRLKAAGARIVIVDRDEVRGPALATELGARFVKADVTNPVEVEAAVAQAAELGTLRVAVSCAGVGWASRTLAKDGTPHDLALFQTIIGINLVGTFNVLRLCAAQMAKNAPTDDGERGVCVLTASVAAYDGQIGQAAYSASKGGIVGMTLPLARDLAVVGIRVNTIAPGLIDTPIYDASPDPAEFKERLRRDTLFPARLGRADEFASLALELLTNSYMNAEVVRLDAGARLQPK